MFVRGIRGSRRSWLVVVGSIALVGCGPGDVVAGGDSGSSSGSSGASTGAGPAGDGVDVTGGPDGTTIGSASAAASSGDTAAVDGTTAGDGPPPPDMGGGEACPHEGPPVFDPNLLDECTPACAGAHCVPAALIPPEKQTLLAPCGTDGFCTPDLLIESGGNFIPDSCESAGGAEGRCLSACLPDVEAQAVLLPQSTCADGDLCVPCYDPFTGEDTGACTLSCDPGPTEPPLMLECPHVGPPLVDPAGLPDCSPVCGGAHCLDAALVPMDLQPLLDACPDGFCVPDPLIETGGNYVAPTCTAFPGTTAEGRCMSECLPDVQAQLADLQQDTCAAGERCVPCTDPFDGTDTGACSVACDMPADPPFTFPTCCPNAMGTDEAVCVPTASIPPADAADLEQQTCPMDMLCVPDEYLPDPTAPILMCNSILGSGACVSNCVNLGLGGIFGQNDCTDNHTCVPCAFGPPGCP